MSWREIRSLSRAKIARIEREADEATRGAELRVVDGSEVAAGERDLRDRSVDGEERRTDERHRVPGAGATILLSGAGDRERGVDHGPAGYPPRLCGLGA